MSVGNRRFETNSLIKASAGTGKTYALATRFIRLMLIDEVKPESIVALTFSRAAAQEIYTKILERLCKAAISEENAEKEWTSLLEDFEKGEVEHGKAKYEELLQSSPAHKAEDFARLLRLLLSTQHLGAIATLDSFILRIVKNFPKEMGFQNAVSVLDGFDEDRAIEDAVKGALKKTSNGEKEIAEAFRKAKKGEAARKCLDAIGDILKTQGWRNFVIGHPECFDEATGKPVWTLESMSESLGIGSGGSFPDLSGIPINQINRKNTPAPEETLIEKLRSYEASAVPDFLVGDSVVAKMARFFYDNPEAESFEYIYYKEPYVLKCGAEGAKALHDAVEYVVNAYLRYQLDVVLAKIKLVVVVEKEYGRMTRRMGKLTFNDFTKFSGEEEFSARGIALKNIEFRFDSTFNHWMLDEFQDTSELQWACLKELVKNAASDGYTGEARSAMAVGDMKQSIYTWRGASAQPFNDISTWEEFEGFARDFRLSHRYGPSIAKFVNDVFGKSNIEVGEVIPKACKLEVDKWREGWVDHISNEPMDYVKVTLAEDVDEDEEEENAFLPAIYSELKPLWESHERSESRETIGILVRNNADGIKVADYLRAKGIKVIWEGMSPVSDDPLVFAVLSLLKLSDHPEDEAAWKTVDSLLGIRALLFPDLHTKEAVSAVVSEYLSHKGLSRTVKEFVSKLPRSEKMDGLVELAVAFEVRRSGDGRIDSFLAFVEQSGRRDLAASSDVVRILTIHRSKGLGFDHVIVPLFEGKRGTSAIDIPKQTMPLYCGESWVLSHLKRGLEHFNTKTAYAYEKMRADKFAESLRTYYVALTRAKKSMYVIIRKDEKPEISKGLQVRDLIARAIKDVFPYENGQPPVFKTPNDERESVSRNPWPEVGERENADRISPSQTVAKEIYNCSAGLLFSEEFGKAAEKGTETHKRFAAIEWGEEEPFKKPSEDAEVWREKSYEIYREKEGAGIWETGQFDRVVFYTEKGERRAKIYDFKTNKMRKGESKEAFEHRMRETYSSQMTNYRAALHELTGIEEDKIGAALFLTSTSSLVEIMV